MDNDKYILSYKKYLYWSNKKSIQPLDFDEYVNTILIPQEKELEDVNKVIKGEIDLKEWLSRDTISKQHKISIGKDYKEIKQMILDRTSFYDKMKMRDRIYCILHDIHEKKLCKCGCGQVINNFEFNYIRGHCNNCEEVKLKKRNSYRSKTGYDNPSQNPEIKKKKEETCLKHFGVRSPGLDDNIKKKLSISNIIAQNDPELKERIRQTNIKKYGKEYYTQTDEYLKKWKEYNRATYGVDFYTQTEEFANSVRATCKNKTDEELQNIIKERISTNNKKFGSDYYSQTNNFKDKYKNEEFVKKILEKQYKIKKKNHSFNISKPEDLIYERLVSKFSDVNVKRQYKSEKYPFACDFYIVNKDLYIEINFHWTHGFEPYDINKHTEMLNEWINKSKTSDFYKNAINVWTIKDPLKRKTARDNNLNWIEFFDIKQFDEWFNKN